jgi:hypothetical protein
MLPTVVSGSVRRNAMPKSASPIERDLLRWWRTAPA